MNTNTLTRLKDLVKEKGTTQASLVAACVEYALDNADIDQFDLVSAKKRGRKPGSKTAVKPDATETDPLLAAAEAAVSTDTVPIEAAEATA